eukprot:s1470_g19.t1
MRDERKGKLLLRYRAVLTDLSTISSCFGMVPVSGSAESIAQATDALMEAFCVEKKQPPRASKVEEAAVDTGLLQHLRDSVTIIVTDAAASEQLATDLQRGRRNAADDSQASMTNIKLVGRDAAHASTRLLKRPFQACSKLKCAVLLTMAADACAISNDSTRECDKEDMDVAQLNLRAQRFICFARALFVDRKVCTLPSFTKDLLLRREPVTVLQDGFAFKVQVTQADLDKAFAVLEDIRCQRQIQSLDGGYSKIDRLQEWVALAEEVVAHEFPSWHLFAAFEAFHLSDSKETEEHGEVLRNLERLAKAFKVSPDTLKKEFTQLQPTATALKKSAVLTNREAWRQAVLRVGERRPQQKAGKGALFSVLAGYQAWTAPSSGVEQLFSTLKNSPTEQSKSTGKSALETDRRLVVAMGNNQIRDGQTSDVLSEAQLIYCSLVARRAQTGKRRLDAGCKRPGRKGTFAEWNRQRKQALSATLDELKTPPRQPAPLVMESTQKEKAFQTGKALKRNAEALSDGLLLPDEVTPALQAEATRNAKASHQSDRQRKKKRTKYVVKTMAALVGAVVLSASVLLGKAGVKLVFHRGLQIDAAVFATHAFQAAEPGLTGLLRDACRNGWHAVRADDLKGRGRKPSLLLRGDGEVVQGFSKTTVRPDPAVGNVCGSEK